MIDKFLKDGWIDLGQILDPKKCQDIADQVIKSRPWDYSVIRDHDDIFNNERHLNVAPLKGGYNLAEKFDLSFIEKNPALNQILNKILGSEHEIMLKKFVVSATENILPEWLKPIVEKKLDGNLAQYIKPEYRDISYFAGIDYHMDLLDYPNFNGDYLTIYIYLTDVEENQSPLNIISASHKYGATFFPHFLKTSNKKDKIFYSKDGAEFEEFETKKLISKKGSIYLWSALTIHGTVKSSSLSPRVALRYSIKKNSNNNKKNIIDNLYDGLKTKLENKTRTDVILNKGKTIQYIQHKRFLV